LSLRKILSRFSIPSSALKSTLFKSGLILTAANFLAGVLGYFYQILMGRLLSPSEFALLSAILALGVFLSSPMTAANLLISRRAAIYHSLGRTDLLLRMFFKAQGLVILVAIAFASMLWLFEEAVMTLLSIPDTRLLWVFFVFLASAALLVINNGIFQGIQKFFLLGALGVSLVATKIVFSVLLVATSFGVLGALLGILFSTLMIWSVGYWWIVRRQTFSGNSAIPPQAKFELTNVVSVVIASVSFTAMTQLDMVLVNIYFSTDEAGKYAAASVLGKALLYIPGGLVQALFSLTAFNFARNKGSQQLFIQSISLTATLCLGVAVVYWMFGDLIIKIVYGDAYQGAGLILKYYGFAIFPMSLILIAEHYLIARGKILFAWLFLLVAPVQLFVISVWHDELWNLLFVMGVSGASLCVIGLLITWISFNTENTRAENKY
jgi:O-antigen/teichoic acid export membrane protein